MSAETETVSSPMCSSSRTWPRPPQHGSRTAGTDRNVSVATWKRAWSYGHGASEASKLAAGERTRESAARRAGFVMLEGISEMRKAVALGVEESAIVRLWRGWGSPHREMDVGQMASTRSRNPAIFEMHRIGEFRLEEGQVPIRSALQNSGELFMYFTE